VQLPEAHQRSLLFEAPAGAQSCRIIQEPARFRSAVDFVVALEPVAELPPAWTTVPWADW
jgi:hypothetical protein